jgi:hypothetical protein
MSLKQYLFFIITGAVFSFFTLLIIVGSTNPLTTNTLGFILFYASLFLTLMGFAAVIGFWIRFIFLKKEIISGAVIASFRQSFFFAILLIASLFLMSKDLFDWLNISLLIFVLSSLEFLFLSYGGDTQEDEE